MKHVKPVTKAQMLQNLLIGWLADLSFNLLDRANRGVKYLLCKEPID